MRTESARAINTSIYNLLKSYKREHLSEKQEEMIARYEREREPSQEMKDTMKAHAEKIHAPVEKPPLKIEPRGLYELFVKTFEQVEGKKFIQTPQSLENLKSLIYYFTQDPKFLTCKNLTDLSTPSLEKGLLIIGGFGCGKTSMMKTFRKIFAYILPRHPQTFALYETNQVVEMYEACQTPAEKDFFWKKMCQGLRHFDDVKAERMAFNYGKANLMKDILEKRYGARVKTHIACNYAPGKPDDPEAALDEFGQFYGPRVYDRMIEMFNILRFKGQSFRK